MKTQHLLKLLLWLALVCPLTMNAQSTSGSYSTAIGLRGGGTSGLTIKHFTGSSTALEGIIGLWCKAFSLTGLYEKHKSAGPSGLNWYYGGGLHVVSKTGRYNRNRYYYRDYYSDGGVGLGIDGIVGIEYKINPSPIAISFDLKPFLEINTGGGAFSALDPGLGLKFTF